MSSLLRPTTKNGQTNGNKHMSPRVEAQGLIPMEEFGTEKTR